MLRISIIQEQVRQVDCHWDWTPIFGVMLARMRRMLRLVAVIPALVGIFMPTSQTMALTCLNCFAAAGARGWELLRQGWDMLAGKTVEGLFWLDRSMAGTVIETVQAGYASAHETMQAIAQGLTPMIPVWNEFSLRLSHPLCTWLLVWGVLLPVATLAFTRLLFFGWKCFVGGKLFHNWCKTWLPAEGMVLVCVCGISTILLYASYCLRWLFELV